MKTQFWLSFLTLIGLFAATQTAQAQTYQPTNRVPVSDNTLGTQVSEAGGNFDITGGVSKGQTLFHSFTDFSVPTSGQANFLNPVGNRDIITRVTGNLFSDINGLVNTNGANFFLINPNGIVFGTNAQLNVGKAFVGSTANSIDLVGGGQTIRFGTNPSGDAPLLSVAPNVLFDVSRLNLGGEIGAINNFGTLQTNNDSQYIGLIGGNVTLDGGKIVAPGGRVELGGLSAVGTASLGTDLNNLRVQLSPNVARGDVSLTNGAKLDVAGAGGGDVAIAGQNVTISGRSRIGGGIGAGLGTQASVAGDININATGNLVMGGGLNNLIFNDVGLNSTGKGGNIIINAGAVSLSNGTQVGASTSGQGNAGNVKITTTNGAALTDAAIFSTVEPGGVGNAGSIDILASSLSLQGVSQLQTITRETDGTQPAGRGNAGNVTVKVTGSVDIAGNRNGLNSGILSSVSTGTVGNAGNINIEARSISLADGAQIKASTSGQGNGGTIDIKTTSDISISGSTPQSTTPITATSPLSSIFTDTFGQGNAGKITIDTQNQGKLLLSNRGSISSSINTNAVGNGGDITISAREIDLRNQSTIFASNVVGGTGDAGNIDIKTTGDISISGSTPDLTTPITSDSPISFISSFTNGKGNAGKITVNTQGKGKLLLSNKALISNFISSVGIGNGQIITILANEIDLKNQGGINSNNLGGQGNAGDINIKTTGDVRLSNLSLITSSTNGRGNAGAITIDTFGKISFSNVSGITSGIGAKAVGNGGDITISAEAVNLNKSFIESSNSDGRGDTGNINLKTKGAIEISNISGILNSNSGQGKTGNISLDGGKQVTLDNGVILATSTTGTGGSIEIKNRDRLLLRNTSNISTNSGSSAQNGNGGNITISSPLIITLPGNNDIAANAFQGNGGNLNITSQGLFGIQFRPKGQDSPTTNDITASSTFGRNGNVNIDTPGTDPGKDSTELPNATTDASNQISQVCGENSRENKLTVTGRGGLPPNANDPLTSDVVWQDARAASGQPAASNLKANPAKLAAPAVGWIFDGKGKVTLVAAATQGQPTGTSVVCPTNE